MLKSLVLAAAAIAALGGAAPLPAVYSAPAGSRPAGVPNPAHPYDAILPNGRTVAPIGASVDAASGAQSLVLAPGGRYALVAGTNALTVVDVRSMRVASTYAPAGLSLFLGLSAFADPADPSRTLVLASDGAAGRLYFLNLDAQGQLSQQSALAVPGAGSITVAGDHRVAYVADDAGNGITAVDVAQRTLLHRANAGFFPWASAISRGRLIVTDSGLMQYQHLSVPWALPPFANAAFMPGSSSALSVVALDAAGDVRSLAGSTAMDVVPDGVETVGGADPAAIAVAKSGAYAYVCMTNVDRIAIVDLAGTPRVVSGLQLRLFDRAPYGTQPDAIAQSPDGKRLYVALAGMNAVAVIDARNPRKLHRLGLIPSGWNPSALAVSGNGRYLFVANAGGNGVSSTLQRIDLRKLPLEKTTYSTLRYTRDAARAKPDALVPPLRSLQRSSAIKHVVLIVQGQGTYDAAFASDAALVPNLRALASQFALATNFYADGTGAQDESFLTGGIVTSYARRTAGGSNDPETYPRDGFIFNSLARSGLTYRDYGGLLRLSGYQPAASATPAPGLGGIYTLNVPALAALSDHVDLDYPGWNPLIGDMRRAKEFIRDFGAYKQQNGMPDFTYVWLPETAQADGDAALGAIVDYLTHQPEWGSTAIFVTAAGTHGGTDRFGPAHTYALVVSPFSRRGYQGAAHLSTVSILKTEEELLGLPPLTLNDLLAGDMAGFFTPDADAAPFAAAR